jgi:hypothetical protein
MSNRSLAAARSRRSPQEVVSNPGMKKDSQPQPRMAPRQGPPLGKEDPSGSGLSLPNKLSVSDAIGLITIRLSKVESHLLKGQHESQTTSQNNASSSVTDVDTVLRNLVSRINMLEKSQDTINQNLEELHVTVEGLEGSTPVNELVPSTDPLVLQRLEKTEKDLSEVKQLVIKLQTMLIDVTMAQKFSTSAVTLPAPVSVPVPPPPPVITPSYSIVSDTLDYEEREEYEQGVNAGSMRLDI